MTDRRGIAAALALLLALPGCHAASAGSEPALIAADKALYTAEAAYQGAAEAVEAAADRGLIHGAAAARIATMLAQAHDALLVARAAAAAGDAAGGDARALAVLTLVAGIEQILQQGDGA